MWGLAIYWFLIYLSYHPPLIWKPRGFITFLHTKSWTWSPYSCYCENGDQLLHDARHEKTDLKVFVVVIPKEGWARPHTPTLLLIWQRQRPKGLFSCDARHVEMSSIVLITTSCYTVRRKLLVTMEMFEAKFCVFIVAKGPHKLLIDPGKCNINPNNGLPCRR